MMARVTRRGWLSLVLALAVILPVAAQDEEHGVRPGGVGVGEGAEIVGNADMGRGRVTTVAKYRDICDVLAEAARAPGKPFKDGSLEFIGHKPWVADLICKYILNAAPHEVGARPPFTVSAERRKFIAAVLDAIQVSAGLNTSAIARDRILVGAKMYRLLLPRPKAGEKPTRTRPEGVRYDVARSIERPAEVLLGMIPEHFTVNSTNLNDWVKAGEVFVLRVHVLAETARLMNERDLDWGDQAIGQQLPSLSESFRRAHSLLNTTARAEWKQQEQKPPGLDPSEQEKNKQTQAALNDETHVNLSLANTSEVPVRGAEGLSLFEYNPIPGPRQAGGHNPRKWYLQGLASNYSAEPGEGEPGGITLPMYRFEALAPESIVSLERMFDEETHAAIETRFTIMAVCVVRILFYTDPVGNNTRLARDHERRHFNHIRGAWVAHIDLLRQSLQRLADDLNRELGLSDMDTFRFVAEPILDTWRPPDDLTAIPIGPLQRNTNASLFQPKDLKVEFLRLRLVRRIEADRAGEPLLSLLASNKPLDPKFAQAQAVWDRWKNERWYRFKNGFVRQFLLDSLRLDLAEGSLGAQGQGGRESLRNVIRQFERNTDPNNPSKAKLDPQAELNKLLK